MHVSGFSTQRAVCGGLGATRKSRWAFRDLAALAAQLEARQVPDRAYPGQEEIGATAHRYEARDVGGPPPHGMCGHRERGALRGHVRADRVDVVVEAVEVAVIHPGVLHEIELPRPIAVSADEVQATLPILARGPFV